VAKQGNKVVSRNFAVLSVGQLGSRLLAFIITIHIAQILLPELFGAVVFAAGLLQYAGLLVDFGFDAYGPIEVGRGTSEPCRLAGNVVTYRALLAVPAFLLLYVVSRFLPMPETSKVMVELYGVSLAANAFDLTWFFLGGAGMWPTVVAEIITQSTLAVGAFAFIHGTADALMMPVFFLIGRLLAVSFLMAMFVRKHGVPEFGIDWPYFSRLLRSAIPLCGSAVMGMISNNFDLMLIGVWLGTSGAGLYGAATRVVWVPTTVAMAYYMALRPLVAHSFVDGFHTVETLFRRSVRVTTALAFGIGTGGALLAPQVMHEIFGIKYNSAASSFTVLLLAFCLMLVSRNYRLILVTFNHQITDLRIMTGAAAINIALNVLLIKSFYITGAAFATLASESFILVMDYFCTRRLINHVPLGRYLLKPIVCSIAMAAILRATAGAGNVYISVVTGAASYAILMVVTRIVTVHEIKALVRTWLPKPSHPAIPAALPAEYALPVSDHEAEKRSLAGVGTGADQ
jgi:O-antigen/teichoic acid export membrane protein